MLGKGKKIPSLEKFLFVFMMILNIFSLNKYKIHLDENFLLRHLTFESDEEGKDPEKYFKKNKLIEKIEENNEISQEKQELNKNEKIEDKKAKCIQKEENFKRIPKIPFEIIPENVPNKEKRIFFITSQTIHKNIEEDKKFENESFNILDQKLVEPQIFQSEKMKSISSNSIYTKNYSISDINNESNGLNLVQNFIEEKENEISQNLIKNKRARTKVENREKKNKSEKLVKDIFYHTEDDRKIVNSKLENWVKIDLNTISKSNEKNFIEEKENIKENYEEENLLKFFNNNSEEENFYEFILNKEIKKEKREKNLENKNLRQRKNGKVKFVKENSEIFEPQETEEDKILKEKILGNIFNPENPEIVENNKILFKALNVENLPNTRNSENMSNPLIQKEIQIVENESKKRDDKEIPSYNIAHSFYDEITNSFMKSENLEKTNENEMEAKKKEEVSQNNHVESPLRKNKRKRQIGVKPEQNNIDLKILPKNKGISKRKRKKKNESYTSRHDSILTLIGEKPVENFLQTLNQDYNNPHPTSTHISNTNGFFADANKEKIFDIVKIFKNPKTAKKSNNNIKIQEIEARENAIIKNEAKVEEVVNDNKLEKLLELFTKEEKINNNKNRKTKNIKKYDYKQYEEKLQSKSSTNKNEKQNSNPEKKTKLNPDRQQFTKYYNYKNANIKNDLNHIENNMLKNYGMNYNMLSNLTNHSSKLINSSKNEQIISCIDTSNKDTENKFNISSDCKNLHKDKSRNNQIIQSELKPIHNEDFSIGNTERNFPSENIFDFQTFLNNSDIRSIFNFFDFNLIRRSNHADGKVEELKKEF